VAPVSGQTAEQRVSAPLGPVELRLDCAAYPVDAVQRAAYRMCDRLSVEVTRDDQTWVCAVYPADGGPATSEDLANLRTEILDQVLRHRIRSETAAARNLILATAFSGLVEQESD